MNISFSEIKRNEFSVTFSWALMALGVSELISKFSHNTLYSLLSILLIVSLFVLHLEFLRSQTLKEASLKILIYFLLLIFFKIVFYSLVLLMAPFKDIFLAAVLSSITYPVGIIIWYILHKIITSGR